MDRSAQFAGTTAATPSNKGLVASREVLNEQIHRVALINDNLRQAIVMIYGPFPPSPSPGVVMQEKIRPDDLAGLFNDLANLLRETERLSTTVNVGH